MIQSIYDDMWQRFELALKHNEYELDPYLSDLENDTRRGITALAYLNQGNCSTVNEIIRFQKEVRELEPEQYYHPSNELHLTVLSVISCLPEFALTEIDVSSYIDVFRSALKNSGKIEISYHGVSASPNCIVIQGFLASDTLERLRNELRTQLTEAGVRVTFDSRYKLVTAHSSIIRFKAPLNDAQQLLALCQRYRNHDFGRVVLEDFELVFNKWYQNLDVTMSLAKYRVQ
ncbi:2'-5' RNA ligase family protein [Vibrio lentus]|uniref:2'-5' RNA ligase family protein n=1 Tax=Vibrio lentus TaxID=136468 RepID=UPI003D0C1767